MLCLLRASYKFCNLTSFIRLRRKIRNINNIALKFIILTDNIQIFRNLSVIIHRYLTKVSAQIIQWIIFERNELSITLSTLYSYPEWPHRQGGCLACRRLQGRFPAEASPINTMHEVLRGYCS